MRCSTAMRPLCAMFLLNLALIAPAFADVLGTVGCNLANLQAAIAATHGDVNEIHILTGFVSAPVAVSNKVILIEGGYADCAATAPAPGFRSTIDGAASAGNNPVFSIGANSHITLRNLQISGGHNRGGRGGGIRFIGSGQGQLELRNVAVSDNRADFGAGIYVEGNDSTQTTEIDIYENTVVSNNTADNAGGGIRIQGKTRLFVLPGASQTSIHDNLANPTSSDDGSGGGLQVLGPARADIGSTGFSGGIIYHNSARLGGGIAIQDGGVVRLFTTDASASANYAIESNSAYRGGGIYLGSGQSLVCGYPVSFVLNTALFGAAIYSDAGAIGAKFTRDQLDSCGPEPASALGAANNPSTHSELIGNAATVTAAVQILDGGVFKAGEIEIDYNNAQGNLISLGSSPTVNQLSNCVIANNTSRPLINSDSNTGNGKLSIDGCTIAGNHLVNDPDIDFEVFQVSGSQFNLDHSIVWQPGANSLKSSQGTVSVHEVIASEVGSLQVGTSSGVRQVDDPRFISTVPFQENYRLRLDSPAVDYNLLSVLSTDLVGNPRNVGLSDRATHYDLGAYERQTGAPAVTFPTDENFDELGGPEQAIGILPLGWSSNPILGGTGWVTAGGSDSPPLAAHASNPAAVGASELYAPAFTPGASATVSFDQYVSLEPQRDGAIMSITIDGGPTREIIGAGGSFIAGGYNGKIGSPSNPLFGFRTWTGQSAGYQHVVVSLPAEASGRSVILSWVVATDDANTDDNFIGYWVDNIHVDLTGVFFENFDELTAPGLPPEWLNVHTGVGAGWLTVASNAASPPNAAFTDDPATITDKSLETPPIFIAAGGRLNFRHRMDLDATAGSAVTFDGVVLEIAIGGGEFKDILGAGGSFASGAYDHSVFPSSGNPLAGRLAWGGTTNGYSNVVVNLPASANGKTVRLRWRMGTDAFESGVGYWLDDIHIDAHATGADRVFCNSFEADPNACGR